MADPHRLSPSGKFLEAGGTVSVAAVQTNDGPIQDSPPFVAFAGSEISVTGLEEGEKLLLRWNGGWMSGGGGAPGQVEVAIGIWDGATFTPIQLFAPFFGFFINFGSNENWTCEKYIEVATDFPFPFRLPPGDYVFAVGLMDQTAAGVEVRLATFSITRFR